MALITPKRDYDKPTKQLALEQIAVSTGYRIPSSKATLFKPRALDMFPGILSDENTAVNAKVADGYIPNNKIEIVFVYRRENLDVLYVKRNTPIVPPKYPYTVLDVLSQINTLLGVQLTKDDVINDTFESITSPFTIRAKPTSLMWIGQKTVDLSVQGKRLLEDGRTRYMENGYSRMLEVAMK